MVFEGCIDLAFRTGSSETCPTDCKLNYCVAQKNPQQMAQFKAILGNCAHNKLIKSCGCAGLSDADLQAMGTPGVEGLNPPPVPKIGTVFTSGGKGANAGGPLAIKGAGADLYFLSVMEMDASHGNYDYKTGADAIPIIQEIELNAMTLAKKETSKDLFTPPPPKCYPEEGYCEDTEYNHGWAYFKMQTTQTNDIKFTFNMRCAVASADAKPQVDGRGYVVTDKSAKCDVEVTNFPFKGSNSYLVIKTATMGVTFTEDLADEDAEGEDTITIGGVGQKFAKTVITGGSECGAKAGVDASCKSAAVKGTKFTNCGTVKWYTPVLKAFTARYFGFTELQCRYWTFQQVATSSSYFLWDPEFSIDKEKAIATAQAQKEKKTGKKTAVLKKPEVKTPPKLKEGQTIAGVDKKPSAPPKAGKPVVKAKVEMKLKKFDAKTAESIKASFAKTLGEGVTADKVKITKATFDVKSELSFPKATKDTFPTATYKSALAADMKVNVSQVAVVVKDARRHLLAGVTVETTISGIEQFEQAEQITKATESTSAIAALPAMKNVTKTTGAPTVTKAPAVAAQFEFEIETDNPEVAKKVTTKLNDPKTADSLVSELKKSGVETEITVKNVETLEAPKSSAAPVKKSSAKSSVKVEESAAGVRSLLAAVLATVAALMLC